MSEIRYVKHERWTFAIDVEKTQDYYRSFVPKNPDSQIYRNYSLYVKNFDAEVTDFLMSLEIEATKVIDDQAIAFNRYKGHYFYSGTYIVFGEIKDGPADEEMYIEAEEFLEKTSENPDFDIDDFSICLGQFTFFVENPNSEIYEGPIDAPEGAFALLFNLDEVPWLLDENVKDIELEPAAWWDIQGKYRDYKNKVKYQDECMEKYKLEMDELFGIDWFEQSLVSKKEGEKVIENWLDAITDSISKLSEAKENTSGSGNYLWHVFSFEIVSAESGDDAFDAFEQNADGPAWLILRSDFVDSVHDLEDVGIVDKDQFNRIFDGEDLIITAKDFSWTFSRTHEESCDLGPYWHFEESRRGHQEIDQVLT